MTKVINADIPEFIKEKYNTCRAHLEALDKLSWRKHYELMNPVQLLGPGKSFGELAVQKDALAKPKKRAASALCRTDCKFAVMSKADYQNVLEIIDRRN